MAVIRPSSQFRTTVPVFSMLRQILGSDSGNDLESPSSESQKNLKRTLTNIALWFGGGLLLGGLAALLFLPGFSSILASTPTQATAQVVAPPDILEAAPDFSLLSQPLLILSLLLSLVPLLAAAAILFGPALLSRKNAGEVELATNPATGVSAEQQPPASEANVAEAPPEAEAQLQEAPEEEVVPKEAEEEEIPKDEEEEEEEQEPNPDMANLASLFEEEDTSLSTAESLAENLPEIEVDELVGIVRETRLKLLEAHSVNREEPAGLLIVKEVQAPLLA